MWTLPTSWSRRQEGNQGHEMKTFLTGTQPARATDCRLHRNPSQVGPRGAHLRPRLLLRGGGSRPGPSSRTAGRTCSPQNEKPLKNSKLRRSVHVLNAPNSGYSRHGNCAPQHGEDATGRVQPPRGVFSGENPGIQVSAAERSSTDKAVETRPCRSLWGQ